MTQISVRVVCALPGDARACTLQLAPGTTARAAAMLAVEAGLSLCGTGVTAAGAALGVHGRQVGDDVVLRDDDRLELYRPLQQDPMERRRREADRSGP